MTDRLPAKRLDTVGEPLILRGIMRLEDSLRGEAQTRFLVARDLVLDRADKRVWLGPTRLELGAKAQALLEELMQHPGRLVTKDRLFDVGWPDQAVSDAVLTTAIREIRRALDDPARAPEWIETQHGSGYRFLPDVDARAVHPGRKSLRKAAARPAPRSYPKIWLAAAALAALAGIAWFAVELTGEDGTSQNTALADVRGVAVLPFAVEGGDAWIGSAMSSRLTAVLSKAPGLFVADSQLVAAMAESERPWEVPRADRIGVVVTGKAMVEDGEIFVDVAITDATGQEIWSRRLSDSQEEIIGLTERIAIETARALKVAADPASMAEMARVGTRSVAAFERYARAAQVLDSVEAVRNPARIEEALENLRQAVAIDPTFSRAALSLSWFEYPAPFDDGAPQAEAKALALAQLARQHANGDIERELTDATLALRDLRFLEAKRKFEALYAKTRETSSEINHSILIQLIQIASILEDRELLEESFRDLTDYSLARGRIQLKDPNILAHSRPMLLRYIDNLAQQEEVGIGTFYRHTGLLLAGDPARARRVMENAASVEGSVFGQLMQVAQACAEGRVEEARAMAKANLASSQGPSWSGWRMAQTAGFASEIARMRPRDASPASQRALLRMLAEPGFDPRPYPLVVAALEDAGVEPLPVPRPAFYCPLSNAG